MSAEENIFDRLRAEFPDSQLEWRVQSSGMKGDKPWAMILCYVDARAVQSRLDSVMGPENWKDEYEVVEGNFKCKLSLRINSEWVTKEDGSPETDIEGYKGGFSKSLVRCASKWGIGRYLYDLPTAWANFVDKGTSGAKSALVKKNKDDNGTYFYWLPPQIGPKDQQTKRPPNKAPAAENNPAEQPPVKFDATAMIAAFKPFGKTVKDLEKHVQTTVDKFTQKERAMLETWWVKLRDARRVEEAKKQEEAS